jgi:hypothetical protein
MFGATGPGVFSRVSKNNAPFERGDTAHNVHPSLANP